MSNLSWETAKPLSASRAASSLSLLASKDDFANAPSKAGEWGKHYIPPFPQPTNRFFLARAARAPLLNRSHLYSMKYDYEWYLLQEGEISFLKGTTQGNLIQQDFG